MIGANCQQAVGGAERERARSTKENTTCTGRETYDRQRVAKAYNVVLVLVGKVAPEPEPHALMEKAAVTQTSFGFLGKACGSRRCGANERI